MTLTPTQRLIGRALLVGVLAVLGSLQTTTATTAKAIVSGALLAGVLAAAEVLTPLNATVGIAKGAGSNDANVGGGGGLR